MCRYLNLFIYYLVTVGTDAHAQGSKPARDNVDVYNADMHAIGRAEFLKSTSHNFIFTSNR